MSNLLSPPQIPPAMLRIVRGAMAAGALLLGAVGIVKTMNGSARHGEGTNLEYITYVAYGFCAVMALGVYAVKALRARMQPAARSQISVMGWAVAEAAAMFGAVVMILGGPPWPWLLGMLVIALSWAQVPADPDEV
jgi:hypothetical protein